MSDESWEAQIESCQGMVRSLALAVQKKLGFAHELDDLIAYGQIGLAQAAQEFDASKGGKAFHLCLLPDSRRHLRRRRQNGLATFQCAPGRCLPRDGQSK